MVAEGVSASIFAPAHISLEELEHLFTAFGRIGAMGLDPAKQRQEGSPIEVFRSKPEREVHLIRFGSETLLLTPDLPDGRLDFDLSLDYPDVERNRGVAKLLLEIVESSLEALGAWWYACADFEGDPPKNFYSSVRSANLRTYFWANYWSDGYVTAAKFSQAAFADDRISRLPSGGWRYLSRSWPDQGATSSERRFLKELSAGGAAQLYRPSLVG